MNFTEIINKVKIFWQELPPARRTALIAVSLASVAALVLLFQWLLKPQYTPLFTNLQQQDAAAVVEKLKELRVPYQLTGEGTTVLVPKSMLYDLRLDIAGSGVLTSGKGFELFDQSKLGMTDFERNLDYQRALQEELRRTIISLNEVEDARVHLVIPRPSIFLQEQQPPSAAVMLKIKSPSRLEPERVKGIMELVSASVAGLKLDSIRIIDTYGNVLSDGIAELTVTSLTRQQQHQLELKRQYEKDLEQRLQAMLTTILGPGKAVAMVTVDMNFDHQEVRETIFGREGSLQSEQVRTEEGTTGGAAGPAGSATNTQPPLYQAVTPATGSYNKSDIIRNYQLDKTETSTIVAPGQIQRLSTAVAVNGPVSPELNLQIQQIVSAGVGFEAARGDQITVHSMAFDDSVERRMAEDLAAQPEPTLLQRYLPWIIIVLAVLMLLSLVAMLIRRRGARDSYVPQPAMAGIPLESFVFEEEEEVTDPEKMRQEAKKKAKQERVRDIARQRPEDVALLLKAWLSEE